MRVQTGADGRAAEGKFVQSRQDPLYPGNCALQLGQPARDHLAQGNRGGVLQMGAAGHDHFVEFHRFFAEGIA